MKTFVTAITLSTLSFFSTQALADTCLELFAEAVKVEKACAATVKNVQANLDYGRKLLEVMNSMPYKSASEVKTTKDLAKKVAKDEAESQSIVNEACDKRWNVSSVYAGSCGDQLIVCEANKKGLYDIFVVAKAQPQAKVKKGQKAPPVAAPARHVMHTYDAMYACLERKGKILKHAH
jgi:hypothetical protein